MIASSNTAKVLAVSAAVLLHGAALWGLSGDAEIEVEGAPGAAQVQIGTSFADMAAGALSASETDDITDPTEPQEVVEPVELIQSENPLRAETPETAEPFEFTEQVPQPVIETTPTVQPVPETLAALTPLTPTPDVVQPTEQTPPVPQDEAVEAIEEPTSAVARSLRPKTRSKRFEEEHKAKPVQRTAKTKPKEPKKKTQKQATAQPKGNAQQNAKAGSTTGTTTAKTKAASSGQGQKSASGNAAASNYPGKVMRKLSRVKKPRVGTKGVAVVAFTISANGGLAAVSLARSSGSGKLDQAALRVVRKAAPFPPPPAGAQRRFSIKIKGS